MTLRRQLIVGTLVLSVVCAGSLVLNDALQVNSEDRAQSSPVAYEGGPSVSRLGAQQISDPRHTPLFFGHVPAEHEPTATGDLLEARPELSKDRAARMLLSGQPREALALSQYVLQTRLEDDYWVEAIPTLVLSAHRLGQLESVVPLMLTEIMRASPDYPDETPRYQSSVLVGFAEALIEVGRADLAYQLLEAVRASEVGDLLAEVISSYHARVARILSGDQQTDPLPEAG